MIEFSTARKATVVAALMEMYCNARDNFLTCAEHLSEALADYPSMDMLEPDEVRARLTELIFK